MLSALAILAFTASQTLRVCSYEQFPPSPFQESRTGYFNTIRKHLNASDTLGTSGAYSAPYPKPRSLTLDPVAEQQTFLQTVLPLLLGECVSAVTGRAAFAAQRMRSIRENRKKRQRRELVLACAVFLFSHSPWQYFYRSSSFMRKKSSFSLPIPSQTGVQRRNSSGVGYMGRGAPCLVPAQLHIKKHRFMQSAAPVLRIFRG